MENLDLKQMSAMVDIIAEEKGLPKETVLNVIEQAIAAAWRKEHELINRRLDRARVDHADVAADQDYVKELIKLFSRR